MVATAFVFATFVALAFTGIAQIISLRGWCEDDAVKQIRAGTGFTSELQLDSTPAVLCRSGSAALELPISPSVATVVFAAIGAAISMFVLVRAARDVRASRAA
ncbi:hypothetical protein AB0E59_36925 [Lentzea sp. NPDC034063]|uniref:hypothetical protein n=1 Tax=unclassified Lentzea TaxID=2643253 RepID=UPI003407CA08